MSGQDLNPGIQVRSPWIQGFVKSGQVMSSQDLIKSGQGQVMTQVGQYAYLSKRLDEPSRLAPFARLYLHPVTSY